jgi:hypothetical protein
MQPVGMSTINATRISHSPAFISIVCPQKGRIRAAADLNRALARGCFISEPPQNDSLDVNAARRRHQRCRCNSRNTGRFR